MAAAIVATGGPKSSGTVAEACRFFDDKAGCSDGLMCLIGERVWQLVVGEGSRVHCRGCLVPCLSAVRSVPAGLPPAAAPTAYSWPPFLLPRSPFAEHLVRVARLGHPAIKGFWVEREPAAIQHCCRAPALKLSCLFMLGQGGKPPLPLPTPPPQDHHCQGGRPHQLRRAEGPVQPLQPVSLESGMQGAQGVAARLAAG